MMQEIFGGMSKRSVRTASQVFSVMATLVVVSACATAADPGAMTLAAPQPTEKPFPQQLQHAMCVRTVGGGEKTNPLWVSKVDNDGFRTALGSSLNGAGLAAPDGSCSYPIDVNLLGLSQPGAGFDLTVTSHVNYKVYDSSGQPYLLATIDAPYTADFSSSFMAITRLKKANEGSIRESVQMFFDQLRNSVPKAQTTATSQ